MKKLILAAVCAVFVFAGVAQAQDWGLFDSERSYLQLGGDWFTIWDGGDSFNIYDDVEDEWSPRDLGTVDLGVAFNITDYNIKTWKSGDPQGDVTGGTFFWRIGEGTWNEQSIVFEENLNPPGNTDQRWGFSDESINVADGLGLGTYTLEFYARMDGDPEDPPSGNRWDSGSADFDNYRGTFEVVPEPGTMGLLAIGLLGIIGLRRRMK